MSQESAFRYIVTGASRGLGRALAERLLATGATVVGASRQQSIQHQAYRHVAVDLADAAALLAALPSLFSPAPTTQRLCLVNNAGTLGPSGYAGEHGTAAVTATLHTNVTAPLVLADAFLNAYADHPAERIVVHVSSGAARRPVDGWSLYCASKAALEQHARVLAVEAVRRRTGVRAYAVAPGIVDTDMQADIRQASEKDFSGVAQFRDYHASGALVSPEAVAEKFIYLFDHPAQFSEPIVSVRDF